MEFGQGQAQVIGVAEPHLELLYPQAQEQVNAVTADLRKRFPIKDSAGLIIASSASTTI